jgi:hypothetical protein
VTKPITLDPNNGFEAVLAELALMHRKKAKDYGTEENENQNFFDQADYMHSSPFECCEGLIALKSSRLKTFRGKGWPAAANENHRETLIDRAVYCAIGIQLWDEEAFYVDE